MPAKPITTHTPESLLSTAEELANFAEEIRAVAERMKVLELVSLEVTNNDQRIKAIEYSDNFAAAARKAFREAQDERLSQPAISASGERKKRVRKPSPPAAK